MIFVGIISYKGQVLILEVVSQPIVEANNLCHLLIIIAIVLGLLRGRGVYRGSAIVTTIGAYLVGSSLGCSQYCS
jgi:hypothetical protein